MDLDEKDYSLAGLRVSSELQLPGLPLWGEDNARDHITIRRARVPALLTKVRFTCQEGYCNDEEVLLEIPGVARYLLRRGENILIDEEASAAPGKLCSYLLGTVFGLLCHQRGITPLHASAIDVEHGCVAFVGESGAGKSTLVAALSARGYKVISDDVCFLQIGAEGEILAWPGMNRIRLWSDAVNVLGYEESKIEREAHGWEKFFIPTKMPQNPAQARPLRRVYRLHSEAEASAATITRLRGAASLEALLQNVYLLDHAEKMGLKAPAFVACTEAARHVPVYKFNRRFEFDSFQGEVELLEDHLSDLYR